MMKRRKFIQRSLGTIALAGVSASTAFSHIHFNFKKSPPALPYDLVATKGGEPAVMFDKAIASLGGIRNFVSRGQTVVIKPNIGWDGEPERASNTNPELIKRIVEHCKNAGAKDIFVFDHTCDTWNRCYASSGIEKAVKEAGGKMVNGSYENYYQEVAVPKGKKLKNAKVHELILESDVYINVPIIKHHSSTKLTLAMKNQMGIVWDRRFWHRNDLHQCIADFVSFRKPDLNIIDGYAILMRNGPRGVSTADVSINKSLIISKDIVAADAAATKIFGWEPSDITYIKNAHDMGLGNMNLSELKINRIKV